MGPLLATGCINEYDLERADHERGTLGEELFEIWHRDTERSATDAEERTNVLEENEDEFVEAVDRAVPPGKVHELDDFLVSALPVIEDGTVPAISRRIPPMIEEGTADDELMATLEDPPTYQPGDYLGPHQEGSALDEAVEYEDLPELLGHFGDVLVAHDGFDDDGEPDIEVPSGYSDLLRSLADVAERQPTSESTDRWATTLRDVLLIPNNSFRSAGEDARQNYVALFDNRGLPRVLPDDDGGVPSPFVDQSGDGFAEVDDDDRFVLDNGMVLEIPPLDRDHEIEHPDLRRDVFGRVEHGPGNYAFDYVDISDTALPYLVRMTKTLAGEGFLYDVAVIARQFFGPPVPAEDDRGTYRGFPDDHPVVDIGDALISGLEITDLPDAAGLTARYLNQNVDDLAFLSYAVGDAGETLTEHPNTDIYPNQTLIYDFIDVIREIAADEALWADFIDALRDPILTRGGEAMSTLLEYRDEEALPVEYRPGSSGEVGEYDQCFQTCKETHDIGTEDRFDCIREDCPTDEILSDPTQFDEPESEKNRSRYQRLFHLLRDTADQEYLLELEEVEEPWIGLDADSFPPMFALPGAAEAFIRAVAGELHLSDYISDEFEESGLGALIELLDHIPGVTVDGESVAAVFSSASELFGARLDPEPTPDQITRLFNQTELIFEEDDVTIDVNEPVCKDGFVMAEHHADGLFAAEASGLIDVIHPLTRAFAKHDREDLLAELFVVVHDHYSAHDNLYKDAHDEPSPMKASNIVSTEVPLKQIFDDGQLFEALRTVALTLDGMQDDEGVAIEERLRQLLHKWLRNDDGYLPRTDPSVIELNDGRQIETVSRIEVILDRLEAIGERLDDDEELETHLRSAAETFFDVVLAAEQIDDDEYQFNEEGVVAFTSQLLRHIGQRAEEMEERGEFEPWLTEDLPDGLHEFYTSRGFYGAVELYAGLFDDDEGRQMMEEASTHFARDGERADRIAMALYAMIVQAFNFEDLMPVGRFVMEVLDPDREETLEPYAGIPNGTLVARLLQRIPDIDEQGHGLDIIARGAATSDDYDSTWSVLAGLLLRYFSPEPEPGSDLTRDDIEVSLHRIGDWLHDDLHGIERYYEIIEFRGNLELEELE